VDDKHDLDIELPDGRLIALEVAWAGDEAIESLRREALGRVWEAPALGHHWWIGSARRLGGLRHCVRL